MESVLARVRHSNTETSSARIRMAPEWPNVCAAYPGKILPEVVKYVAVYTILFNTVFSFTQALKNIINSIEQ